MDKEIYTIIGQIMEVAQYLEYNMALMIRLNEVLKEFKNTGRLTVRRFQEIEREASQLHESLMNTTMGKIIFKLEEVQMFERRDIKLLKDNLSKRNYLVHQYFKNDDKKMSKEELVFMLKDMNRINSSMCDIIEQQLEEHNSISKSN